MGYSPPHLASAFTASFHCSTTPTVTFFALKLHLHIPCLAYSETFSLFPVEMEIQKGSCVVHEQNPQQQSSLISVNQTGPKRKKDDLKCWPLIGRANLILTNGLSFALGSQPLSQITITQITITPNLQLYVCHYLLVG